MEFFNQIRVPLLLVLLCIGLWLLYIVIRAVWRERRQNHRDVCPMWIKTQGMGINGPDRPWNLKER